MKEHSSPNFLIAILIFLFLCAMPALQAQTAAPASIDPATKTITLGTDADFTFHYEADISKLSFESKAAAELYFEDLSNKMVTFKLTPEGKMVDIYINVRKQPNWKAADWNTYLASLGKEKK